MNHLNLHLNLRPTPKPAQALVFYRTTPKPSLNQDIQVWLGQDWFGLKSVGWAKSCYRNTFFNLKSENIAIARRRECMCALCIRISCLYIMVCALVVGGWLGGMWGWVAGCGGGVDSRAASPWKWKNYLSLSRKENLVMSAHTIETVGSSRKDVPINLLKFAHFGDSTLPDRIRLMATSKLDPLC